MTQFLNFTGTVQTEPKIIKQVPTMLYVHIRTTDGQDLNAIVVQHALDFLYRAHDHDQIAVYGHFNRRHQFVVNKYFVRSQVA